MDQEQREPTETVSTIRADTIATELRPNTLGLPGVLMQGIATISPGFSQLATFTSTVALAAIVAPLAFALAGVVLVVQALCTAQVAKEFPAAGGWFTWIARTLHPRAGFFAGWVMVLWLPPCGVLVLAFLGQQFLQPAIQSYYGVDIPWWVYPIVGVALVALASYRGIRVSERVLITTGSIEIIIMVALAISGLAHPGPGGFSFQPINPANFGKAPDVFLAIVFAVFAFTGWESVGPLAEESRRPRRNVPLALVGSILILMIYEFLVTWGNLLGIGISKINIIPTVAIWPVATFAQHVWKGAWIILAFALLNSALAVCLGCFNGGTRTFFAMGRSGVLPSSLGRVSERRKVPDNAIHLQVAVSVGSLVLAAVFGVANVFLTWAITITLAIIVMYILCDIGVIRYYLTEARSRFNPVLHLILPVAAGIAVAYVGYKSAVPLPPNPEKWAPVVLVVYFAVGGVVLLWLHYRGHDEWMARSRSAMEEVPEPTQTAQTNAVTQVVGGDQG
jgi:amino acid transporter